MNDRDVILAAIRRSLKANRRAILDLAGHAPPVRPGIPEAGEALIERFCAELQALSGFPHRCLDAGQAAAIVTTILEATGPRRAIAWDEAALPIAGLGELVRARGIELLPVALLGAPDRQQLLQELSDIEVCLSGADAGIAQSGTIAVVSGPGRPRTASLLAPVHIAVLRAADIVPTLEDALDLLRRRFGPDFTARHSNLTLITGPSRTADIEMTLTLGVHGPKEIHVIVVG